MSNPRSDKNEELLTYFLEANGKPNVKVNHNAPYANEVIQCFKDLEKNKNVNKTQYS